MTSDQIDNEINFYLRNIGKELGGNEQNKIMSITSKVINCTEYMDKIKSSINPIIMLENFNISTDLSELIKTIISVNNTCDFYKIVEPCRMQYVLYGILYSVLIKNHIDIMNNINITDFRLMFSNSMDLLMMPSNKLKMEKENCINCMSRSIRWLNWLENKLKIN